MNHSEPPSGWPQMPQQLVLASVSATSRSFIVKWARPKSSRMTMTGIGVTARIAREMAHAGRDRGKLHSFSALAIFLASGSPAAAWARM